jgi:hypothetical protein
MRGLVRFALAPAVAGLLAAAFLSPVLFNSSGLVARAQGGPTLGIDAEPSDNTAVSLGVRDVCIAVKSGDVFDVDITVDGVTGLSAWEAYLALDTSVVSIIDRNVQYLLSSPPGSNTFDISESVPEDASDDGRYRVGGAIITDPPLGVDGAGVLARLTLKATGSGVSNLSVKPIQTDAGEPVGPVLTDTDANHLGDSNDDSFFDGPSLDAAVAVDQDCPSDSEGPVAALTGGDGGGVSAWIFAAAALGVVLTAGFGGIALIRLRRPSKTAS